MTTKQVNQVKVNILKAFRVITTYSKVEKAAFLNGAAQFLHALYMQSMISDDENTALRLMIRNEYKKYK